MEELFGVYPRFSKKIHCVYHRSVVPQLDQFVHLPFLRLKKSFQSIVNLLHYTLIRSRRITLRRSISKSLFSRRKDSFYLDEGETQTGIDQLRGGQLLRTGNSATGKPSRLKRSARGFLLNQNSQSGGTVSAVKVLLILKSY